MTLKCTKRIFHLAITEITFSQIQKKDVRFKEVTK